MAADRLLQRVEPDEHPGLAEYEAVAHLAQAVHELRSEAGAVLSRLAGRTVWMVNSTARGGGVAEMLLNAVPLLRDLGVRTEWVVIGSRDPEFFQLTKAIQDDPESQEVLAELRGVYVALHPAIQDDIAIVTLPMRSREQNALLVNALQRASTLVVQNSLREGFGLTIAEAMWKRIPVLSNGRSVGPRTQIRDRLDGRLIEDPANLTELGQAINDMLANPAARQEWGRNGQRRVHELFLVTAQLRGWGRLLARVPMQT